MPTSTGESASASPNGASTPNTVQGQAGVCAPATPGASNRPMAMARAAVRRVRIELLTPGTGPGVRVRANWRVSAMHGYSEAMRRQHGAHEGLDEFGTRTVGAVPLLPGAPPPWQVRRRLWARRRVRGERR